MVVSGLGSVFCLILQGPAVVTLWFPVSPSEGLLRRADGFHFWVGFCSSDGTGAGALPEFRFHSGFQRQQIDLGSNKS
jgi:hypothetical protein